MHVHLLISTLFLSIMIIIYHKKEILQGNLYHHITFEFSFLYTNDSVKKKRQLKLMLPNNQILMH